MKIRNGFVSNSSATSFCIYGWDDFYLRDSTGEAWDNVSIVSMIAKVKELYGINIIDSNSPSSNIVFGVGNREDEIDHYNENWEDYIADSPDKKDAEKLDEIAKEMGLPHPKMYSATWFNG